MSRSEIRVTDLIGRCVRDPQGRSIGRIEELVCEIELRPGGGRDYVVREIHVGDAGRLEAIAAGTLMRALLRTVGRGSGYGRFRVPWEWMDLVDPTRPRVTVPREQLAVE